MFNWTIIMQKLKKKLYNICGEKTKSEQVTPFHDMNFIKTNFLSKTHKTNYIITTVKYFLNYFISNKHTEM